MSGGPRWTALGGVAASLGLVATTLLVACSGSTDEGKAGPSGTNQPPPGGSVEVPKVPSCAADGGNTDLGELSVSRDLFGDDGDGWLGSPAVVDLNQDGKNELVAAHSNVTAWSTDGKVVWSFEPVSEVGRVWSSPVVADFRDGPELEVVFAARDHVWMLDATGQPVSGWPVTWRDEIRSLAAGDVNGDGQLDVVVATTDNDPDVLSAYDAAGRVISGFPPIESKTIGCASGENCWMAGAYDQNLAVGDLDADGQQDIIVPTDNAYAGIYHGSGEAFDANSMFEERPKTPGVRYLHALADARQGWAEDEETALQAHFTNTPPAIADVDGDGKYDVVMLASVQNASQEDREQGVALWVVRPDASRLEAWQTPFHAKGYLSGLWDLEEDNAVAATNQVTVADLDATKAGPEFVFAGFDGRIHAVTADAKALWEVTYTEDPKVLTGGVAVADLTRDGRPEIVFATYSPEDDRSHLIVLDAGGKELSRTPLPQRGAESVPTIADWDGDGTLEIAVSLRKVTWDGSEPAVRVFRAPNSSAKCLLWPTGRANWLRNGWIRASDE
jgi:hypothetical protein